MGDKKRKAGFGKGGWIFLLVVILIYGISAVFDWELNQQALKQFIKTIDRIAPALLFVFVLLFIINLFLDPKKIEKYLGKQSGMTGWVIAIGVGILSVGPVYAWYGMLENLKRQGMKSGLIAAFLYSRAIKLSLLPFLIHYFGMGYTLALCLYFICFAIVNGMIMQKLEHKWATTD